jgi:mannose-6-phosphate isomerase-like protein (cupin superfamily)
MTFTTTHLDTAPKVTAPDGSEVAILAAASLGSMATFTLPPGAVSKPVAHRTVEELWYVISGRGRMWRRLGDHDEIVELRPGGSLAISVGTSFQFRCDGTEKLVAVGVTMPPWPGEDEAYPVAGFWDATA